MDLWPWAHGWREWLTFALTITALLAFAFTVAWVVTP